jgi:DedD protein
MPFFNFRRTPAAAAAAGSSVQTESVEAIRKRAKHRLIGAVVLVLLGVVGFPLLFDTQPRPIADDIPIEIPGQNTVKPLVMPAPAPAASGKVAEPEPALASEKVLVPDKKPEPAAEAPPSVATVEPKPEPKPAPKPEVKPEPKVAVKAPAVSDEAARAKALLEGKQAPGVAKVRLVVQVGAFADADKAHEVRLKLERAGLKTYTQVADTKDGKRTRVRVGPFSSRAEADKVASKIKSLDLPVAVLTL